MRAGPANPARTSVPLPVPRGHSVKALGTLRLGRSGLGALLVAATLVTSASASGQRSDSFVQREADIATHQPGPHSGEGRTTAYPFFEDAEGFDIVFRKRALHPGASIGEHSNDKDEIYYVLSGQGELMLDGEYREVGPGDAILTRSGSRHGLRQRGPTDLVILVVFRRPQSP